MKLSKRIMASLPGEENIKQELNLAFLIILKVKLEEALKKEKDKKKRERLEKLLKIVKKRIKEILEKLPRLKAIKLDVERMARRNLEGIIEKEGKIETKEKKVIKMPSENYYSNSRILYYLKEMSNIAIYLVYLQSNMERERLLELARRFDFPEIFERNYVKPIKLANLLTSAIKYHTSEAINLMNTKLIDTVSYELRNIFSYYFEKHYIPEKELYYSGRRREEGKGIR